MEIKINLSESKRNGWVADIDIAGAETTSDFVSKIKNKSTKKLALEAALIRIGLIYL